MLVGILCINSTIVHLSRFKYFPIPSLSMVHTCTTASAYLYHSVPLNLFLCDTHKDFIRYFSSVAPLPTTSPVLRIKILLTIITKRGLRRYETEKGCRTWAKRVPTQTGLRGQNWHGRSRYLVMRYCNRCCNDKKRSARRGKWLMWVFIWFVQDTAPLLPAYAPHLEFMWLYH